MQFKNIIGQQQIKQQLIRTFNENRLSHAQLFTGPSGLGKLGMAIAFAQYISCSNKTQNDSCGNCSSCKKYSKLIHPDLHFVFPVVSGKGFTKPVSDHFIDLWRQQLEQSPYFSLNDWYEKLGVDNAQGMIFADESNEIIRKLSLKSYEGGYKVMLIWLPEKMNEYCANKLLKIIEEPLGKSLFLMVSEEPKKILKTILSRTQMIQFQPIDKDSLFQAIKENSDLDKTEAENIIRLSAGSYRKAKKLLEKMDENAENFDYFTSLMRHCYSRKINDIMACTEELSGIGRERQKNFLNYCSRLIRENFIMNLHEKKINYLNGKELNFSQKFSPFINERNVRQIANELSLAHRDIERMGNPKIVFLDLGLKLVKLLRL